MPVTTRAVTRVRNPFNIEPLPRFAAEPSAPKTARINLLKRAASWDVYNIVRWLNASKIYSPRCYRRVHRLLLALHRARELRREIASFAPDQKEWDAALRQHEEKKRLFNERAVKEVVSVFPADRRRSDEDMARFRDIERELNGLVPELQRQLRRYSFSLSVNYIRPPGSINLLENIWSAGVVPKERCRGFEVNLGGWYVSEAEAVLALVRLDASDRLESVRLCQTCGQRWLVAAKPKARFCSSSCRESYYINSPDYRPRKAANQRKYREGLKNMRESQARLNSGRSGRS